MRVLITALFALSLACHAAPDAPLATSSEAQATDPLADFAGRWVREGPRNIIGRGTDEIWTIARGVDGWTIELTLVRHPSVNEEPRQPEREEFAATPLHWSDGCIEFNHPGSPTLRRNITVERDGDQLFLPALIERDERTWEFRSWNEGGVIQFEHDPRVVAEGSVTHPFQHWVGGSSVYRTQETASVWGGNKRVTSVRIFQNRGSATEELCGELVLEHPPHLPLVRTPFNSVKFMSAQHERQSDADWARIQALPRVESPRQ